MPVLPPKAAVRAALRDHLAQLLEQMRAAQRETAAAAVHPEAKAEGDKDTRATELSYIARGQAMRAEDLGADLLRLEREGWPRFGPDDPIDVGALVAIELASGQLRVVLVLDVAGGTEVVVDGARIQVLSPAAPLASELLGKRQDDDVELVLGGRRHDGAIVAVA
jgi:transcription elongation GreA/GreB family factor